MVDSHGPKRSSVGVGSTPKSKSAEAAFTPPESVAQAEDAIEGDISADKKPETSVRKGLKNPFIPLKAWWQDRTKKQKIIIGVAGVVVVLLIAGGGYKLLHKTPVKPVPVVKKEVVKPPPKPTTEPSHLTGVVVPIEDNLLPVTAVMIENSPDARPQSGLKDAGVVFEAVAEGGITRFLTLFQEAQPDYVGPVRSVRPYYIRWLLGFDAAVAHVGGSGEALGDIGAKGVKDLDQFYNSGSYHRITQRYAPHNVYTSLAELLALEKSKGFTSSNFTGFTRKADNKATTPVAKTIDFAISGPLYNAHYDYDAASNSYLRSEGGKPHTDERSGQQIKPKVVIALVMTEGIDPDGIHTTYNTIGSGTAYVFQDGWMTQGTWTKNSEKEQFKFTDSTGATLALDAGQTWISVVGSTGDVTYSP